MSKLYSPTIHGPGGWMREEVRKFVASKMSTNGAEAFLTTSLPVFGDQTAEEFVTRLVKEGKAQSYADAWHEVMGIARRIYE